MKTQIENGRYLSATGTSLQGYINASYDELIEAFGEPTGDGDGFKVDVEWVLRFDGETIATIYNWKNGQNHEGDAGMDVEDMTSWHVGGHSADALTAVKAALA